MITSEMYMAVALSWNTPYVSKTTAHEDMHTVLTKVQAAWFPGVVRSWLCGATWPLAEVET